MHTSTPGEFEGQRHKCLAHSNNKHVEEKLVRTGPARTTSAGWTGSLSGERQDTLDCSAPRPSADQRVDQEVGRNACILGAQGDMCVTGLEVVQEERRNGASVWWKAAVVCEGQ